MVVPFVLDQALNKYGFRTVLRAWAIFLVIIAGPFLYYDKPRLPVSLTSQSRRSNLKFLRTSTFWVMQIGNILEGLGFFIPVLYLPVYAKSMGFSSIAGTLMVTLCNSTSVLGAISVGSLIDRLHVTNVILISTIGASMSVFLLWGLAASLPVLCIFSLTYGLFAGGFSSTWPGIVKEVQKREAGVEAGTVLGLLSAGRGIGSVACGPLSEALLNDKSSIHTSIGYATGYRALITFTGVSAVLGGISWVERRFSCS